MHVVRSLCRYIDHNEYNEGNEHDNQKHLHKHDENNKQPYAGKRYDQIHVCDKRHEYNCYDHEWHCDGQHNTGRRNDGTRYEWQHGGNIAR